MSWKDANWSTQKLLFRSIKSASTNTTFQLIPFFMKAWQSHTQFSDESHLCSNKELTGSIIIQGSLLSQALLAPWNQTHKGTWFLRALPTEDELSHEPGEEPIGIFLCSQQTKPIELINENNLISPQNTPFRNSFITYLRLGIALDK